jgi:hypothetical protein
MAYAGTLLHVTGLLTTPIVLDLLFDRQNKILLLRFPEKLTRANFDRMDAALAWIAARRGPVDAIIDFSDVSEDVDTTVIIAHAHVRPPVQGRRRVFIVSTDLMAGIFRMYTIYSKAAGFEAPKIARSLDEALDTFGASEANFEPLGLE